MKKICILFIFLLGSSLFIHAQRYYKESAFLLGGNLDVKVPTGNFKNWYKTGVGINISSKYLINQVLGIGFESGYHSFKSKFKGNRNTDQDSKCHIIPVLMEANFYIPTWDRTLLPYFGVHFGGYFTMVKVSQRSSSYLQENVSEKLNSFSLGGGPNIGLLMELSEHLRLDLKLKGDYIPNIKEEYALDDLGSMGRTGFNKILTFGGSLGLLYVF